LNGSVEDPVDFYNSEIVDHEVHLLDFWPEPGNYILRLDCVGKNSQSQGYYLGIESLRLRERRPRVIQFGHGRDRDWKRNPVLYE
jgi:hypothetical protein